MNVKGNLLFLLTMLLPMTASAYDAEINGIYYNFDFLNRTAEVTYLERRINDDYTAYVFISDYHDTVIIPGSVTFRGKTYNVTSIGDHAFVSCIGLTSVTIPKSVTSIGDYAFAGCSGLSSITIPNRVTSIGGSAFSNSSSLTSIIIPNSVTSIGEDAFAYCSSLTSFTIPETLTSIEGSTFIHCHNLTSIAIPNSVTNIGSSAFGNCYRLTSINIPDCVTSIGRYAFDGTAWFNSQPNGLVYAGKMAYKYKGTMPDGTQIVVKDGTLGIVDYAFQNCSNLTSITIPKSVASIGTHAFSGCTGLTDINVATENATYDSRDNCNAIITTATNSLFLGCKNTIIPNSVTSIGSYAFSGCSGLTSISIPEGVASIGGYAFYGCSSLTYIIIPNSVTIIGHDAFYGCSSLTSVTIGNSVTSISDMTFYHCSSLTSFIIPESVTSIGDYAFSNCNSLTSIIIPSSVKDIDYLAFYGCGGLTDVYCLAEDVPKTQSNAFLWSSIASATLYVPAVSIDAYKAKTPWSDFGSIVPLTQDEIDGIKEIKNDSLTPTLSEGEGDWYDLNGRKILNGQSSSGLSPEHQRSARMVNGKLPRGINIIRNSDGTSRKVLVK